VKPEEFYQIMRSVPVRTKGTKGSRKQFTRVFLFLMVAFNTASRKGAIEGLRWDNGQIDFEDNLIDFNPPGRRQTAKRRPKVAMNKRLRAVLWKAYQERDPKDPYVLPGGGAIRHAFDTAMGQAGFEWVTPHVIRHTWITWAFRRGESRYDIADVTGDDPETLEKHYRHNRPEWLRKTVEGGAAATLDRGGNGALRPDLGVSHGQSDGQRKGSSRAAVRDPLS
jgi:integrase